MGNLILSVNPEHMSDTRLDLLDKLILSYISTWEQKGLTCFAKDDLFSKLFGEPRDKIYFSLLYMEKLKLITQVSGNGGRLLKINKQISNEIEHDNRDIFDHLY